MMERMANISKEKEQKKVKTSYWRESDEIEKGNDFVIYKKKFSKKGRKITEPKVI